MRKFMLAALLALSTLPALGAAPDAQAAKWNRYLTITAQGKVIIDRDPNTGNPFESEAACTAGLQDDTLNVYAYLHMNGVDIEKVDVSVTCEPAGQGI